MRRWLRKLRGLAGLGAVGAFGGAVFGLVWGLVELLGGPGIVHLPLSFYVAAWSALGATGSIGFGILLSATAGDRRLEDLNPWHARLLGGIVGALSPLALQALVAGSLPTLVVALLASAICGTVGMGAASGLLAIAQGALDQDALPTLDDELLLE